MKLAVLVLAGSGVGGVLRFWVGNALPIPWGTMLINVVGSFVIGLGATGLASDEARAFVMVGLCGGFTTFSAYSLQNLALLDVGRYGAAAVYMAGSVGACLAATWAGWILGRYAT